MAAGKGLFPATPSISYLHTMITDQITLLNETVLECLNETKEIKIVKTFTDVGLRVLGADFGFVWLNSSESQKLELVYKSPNLPFTPNTPRDRGRNHNAIKNSTPDFVSETKKTPDAQYVSKYVKSFVIIPLAYKKSVYGSMVLCFKKQELFPREKKVLSVFLGNSVAQAITIHRLVENKIFLEQEKTKIEFMANATHELRTPLAIMKGNVDLALMEKGDQKSAQNALRAVNIEIKILSEILKDLVILTSGENKKNLRSLGPVNIADVINRTVKRLGVISSRKNIHIHIHTKDHTLIVLGNENYLEEKLFLNIIKNAIYYGKEGGSITINIHKEKNSAVVEISDDGIGISKEELPKIFGRFYRGDKAHFDSSNHTGLGLAIAKWVAEKHEGSIFAKSTEGKGSTFTVTLPLAKTN